MKVNKNFMELRHWPNAIRQIYSIRKEYESAGIVATCLMATAIIILACIIWMPR